MSIPLDSNGLLTRFTWLFILFHELVQMHLQIALLFESRHASSTSFSPANPAVPVGPPFESRVPACVYTLSHPCSANLGLNPFLSVQDSVLATRVRHSTLSRFGPRPTRTLSVLRRWRDATCRSFGTAVQVLHRARRCLSMAPLAPLWDSSLNPGLLRCHGGWLVPVVGVITCVAEYRNALRAS